MRIFIAVTLDPAVRGEVAALIDGLRRSGTFAAPVVRWVPEGNLHLTLRFLGAVDEPGVSAVGEALAFAWTQTPFTVSLGPAGVFPPRGAPRVIWLDVRDRANELRALQRELERRLAAIGYARDRQPFRPHLTIGRVKRDARAAGRAIGRAVAAIEVPAIRWTVDRVVLMESRLASEGAAYHEVAAAPLEPGTHPAG